MEAWPSIKRAVPAAHLRVFYNLATWLRSFDQTPYYPPIERLRARALWCEEALKRLSDPKWGITVVDQVGGACHTGDRTCWDADVLLKEQ